MMELGVSDPAIMIMAVGDSRCDNNNGVFQLGQFESGDAEMDMWLERIWISQGGGGNSGESYNWAYYYALNHIKTDAWEKRKQKGFIFTIGDDHCHENLSVREIDEVMGEVATARETVSSKALVDALKDKWHVYHLELGNCEDSWRKLLGKENVLICGRNDYNGMADKIAETVASFVRTNTPPVTKVETEDQPDKPASVTPML